MSANLVQRLIFDEIMANPQGEREEAVKACVESDAGVIKNIDMVVNRLEEIQNEAEDAAMEASDAEDKADGVVVKCKRLVEQLRKEQ